MRKHNSNRIPSVPGFLLMSCFVTLIGISSNLHAAWPITLYQSDQLTITAKDKSWCDKGRVKVDARYAVDHLKRDDAFSPNYGYFVLNSVNKHIKKFCKGARYLTIYNYNASESASYDEIKYDLNEMAQIDTSAKYAENAMDKCSDKPFCNLPAGLYLNAIYENNTNLVRKIGRDKSEEVKKFMQRKSGGLSSEYITAVSTLFKGLNPPLIRTAANKYMHDYKYMSGGCFKQGADTKTYRYDTPDLLHTDEWGVTSREKGVHYKATYRVNPEFFPIRDQIASASASGPSSNQLQDLSPTLNEVYKGIEAIRGKMDCNSAEVKQFERNFIALTTQYINNPSAWESGRISRASSTSQLDKITGAQFLAENKLKDGVVTTENGLQYKILKQGEGEYVSSSTTSITVHLRYIMIDGRVTRDTYKENKPYTADPQLSNYPRGWHLGLHLLKPGGKIRFFVPSHLGYVSSIPTMIYEVELLSMN